MDSSIAIAVVAGGVSLSSAYFAATRSQRKQPEDRDAVIAETAAKVVAMIEAQLQTCLEQRAQTEVRLTRIEAERTEQTERHKQQIAALKGRVTRLENQLRELGHEPVNGSS